ATTRWPREHRRIFRRILRNVAPATPALSGPLRPGSLADLCPPDPVVRLPAADRPGRLARSAGDRLAAANRPVRGLRPGAAVRARRTRPVDATRSVLPWHRYWNRVPHLRHAGDAAGAPPRPDVCGLVSEGRGPSRAGHARRT